MRAPLLEVCVDTPAGLAAAVAGGADRIELCAALDLGGLTPSAGLMALAARAPVPVRAMIRPRAGGFAYRQDERTVMLAEIDIVRSAGLEGVVIGATTPDGRLDMGFLAELAARAAGMGITLHRVVDLLPEEEDAVAGAIALGIDTILTSGGPVRAEDGAARSADMVRRAAGRATVMAGSGIDAATAPPLVAATGVRAVHASCRAALPRDADLAAFGFAPDRPRDTDEAAVRRLRRALDELLVPNAGERR